MNQENFISFQQIDKQDTTQDGFHLNKPNLDQSANQSQENAINVQVPANSQIPQNTTLDRYLGQEANELLDAKKIIDINYNAQNDQDETCVWITTTKKYKLKSNQKFSTTQDNQSKQQKSPSKPILPTITEQSVKSNANDIDPFKDQKGIFQDIETVKSEVYIENSVKTVKSENQEIDNRLQQNFIQDDRTSFSKLDQSNNTKQPLKFVQIMDLNLKIPQESNKLFKRNTNVNHNLEVQNSPFKQTVKEDQIDQHIMNQARALMIKKLDMDMREFNDIIQGQNQQILKLRRLIYDRLQFVINYLFRGFIHHISQLDFNSQVCLFGSCATGLALPESDIDIGITGFEMCSTCQLYVPIQKLTEFLQRMRWVNSIVAITSSTMPLIKLQVDPTISFVQSTLPIGLPYIDLILNPDENITRQIFSVDISFFQYSGPKQNQHLGLISTELTLQWLSFYSELRSIVLLFKSLLKKRGLNDQFKGGMSSFCIIQMVLAFLECFYHSNQASSIGYTTYNFLKFYGTEFDPKRTGISYKGFNENPFYGLNEYDDQSEITIVSPITNEIISSATSFVLTILQDLKALYQATENEVTFFYEKLKYNKKKKGKKEERNLFQKELNKLRPLFSTTVYNKT
ncbi:unnamed protein product (macronuclear) [Paramecium tetraurelia]|uniref:Poly(A) RNA polymerase mitochondrial-like central palm domain-containing protein n=1 Tax=Paramecium tetraurelia TaxID=5888 RepID=A0CXE8_PARTE|nr:uncharacterized protein GSPATT00011097001 [Paramecium tetraurelia]CAK75465.1 unnamed protein product [Paramecium tetraurelia]|eukprot:XP_001442862.1 hypothetical protein (macronuclear) [Paramecium tetraurelia strain d4-2]